MQLLPIDETSTPLPKEHAERLYRLVEGLSPEQLNWVSGFLAGINWAQAAPRADAAAHSPPQAAATLTVLYGSQTGNGEEIAHQAQTRARELGFNAAARDMGEYKKTQLKEEQNLLIVVSTHGEGEPPDDAEELHEFLHSKRAPKLDHLSFSVLALGDTSYDRYCQTGKDFDQRLESLGAQRMHTRVDCDVDYEDAAEAWIEGALGAFSERLQANQTAAAAVSASRAPEKVAPIYTKKNPFPAPVLENLVLNGRGSAKETRHIELSLEGSGLAFEPGDSLGVVPSNAPEVVAALVETLDLDADETSGEATLAQALTHDYEITTLTRPVIERYAQLAQSRTLDRLLAENQREALAAYMYGREIVDLVSDYPVKGLSAGDFVGLLRKLPARLYSLASSYKANPDEAHLTVCTVRYESYGRQRKGVASTLLADRIGEDDTVPVFVDTNKNFKLPASGSAPIVMVGPGTGVAPFRAFVEEREHLGTDGKNWLFFGDQHLRTDFLYQTEWQRWLDNGALQRLDVAFSRDQADKVYVQHRLRERAREVYAWLQEGAYFYVCGDADHMAPDVHAALLDIVETEGGMSRDKAGEYVKQLQRDKRYQRDVY